MGRLKKLKGLYVEVHFLDHARNIDAVYTTACGRIVSVANGKLKLRNWHLPYTCEEVKKSTEEYFSVVISAVTKVVIFKRDKELFVVK